MFEMPRKIRMAHRKFRNGERVFVCDYENEENTGFGKLVNVTFTPDKNVIYIGSVATIKLEKTGQEVSVLGYKVYKIAPRVSKQWGEIMCYEHINFGRGHNYRYYMPSNDENYC